MSDWVLTVCVANFLSFCQEFLGMIMKGSGVTVMEGNHLFLVSLITGELGSQVTEVTLL